ncbi:hypothetical protein [Nonomuraea sp. NPDC049028]|uniref:hypothetical protein n=1 Tax=Nonomuraea sp. NPDC049028 TaxID=3364348 RepID=UPI00371CC9F3
MSTETASDGLVRLTAEEAIERVTTAAFKISDPESSDFGREIVHSFAGFIGADWDLHAVVEAIKSARDIAWMDHFAEHNLAVLLENGRVRFLAVKRPEAAQAEQNGGAA